MRGLGLGFTNTVGTVRAWIMSTSPSFLRSRASHPVGPWPACPKNGKSVSHGWGWEVLTQVVYQFVSDVTASSLVG